MMKHLPLCALVLCAVAVSVVTGTCQSEVPGCTSSFQSTVGASPNVETFCAALTTYSSCIKSACPEVDSDFIDNLLNQASEQGGIKCGSCMIYISLVNVMLFALASLYFKSA